MHKGIIILVVAQLLLLAACTVDPLEASSNQFATMTPDEVLNGLENADNIEIKLPEDYRLMRSSADLDNLEWHINWCNGDDEAGAEGGKEMSCSLHYVDHDHISDPSILKYDMEILFRSCGIYALSQSDSDEGISCGILGSLFFQIGNTLAARAVWEHAPGCHVKDDGGHPVDGCIDAILGQSGEPDGTSDSHIDWDSDGVNYREAYAQEPQVLLKLASDACTQEHDYGACQFLKDKGANINLNSVASYNSRRIQQNENADAVAARSAQLDREEHREQVNAMIGALSNLPGASDPNGIVDAANREAAQMVAAGAANDTSRAQVTLQHLPVTAGNQQQATPEQANPTATPLPANPDAAVSTGTGSESCPYVEGYSDSGVPRSKAYPDSGANCNPVREENSCVRVVSNVWNSGPSSSFSPGTLTLVLSNSCSSAIRITAWGPPGSDNPGETVNVGPGRQYTFLNNQQTWHYQADDGVDCPVNSSRPGCSNIGH